MEFTLKEDKYKEEHDKVLFASMHLKGNAFTWFELTATDYLENTKAT